MKILGIIPSRYGSTRFPGKPLVDILGKTMIQRVYEQARLATRLDDVIVATDDQRIFDHVQSFGGKAVITSAEHPSGTDRCCEVVEKMQEVYDVAINIQGDEPLLDPKVIDSLCESFDDTACEIATVCTPIKRSEALEMARVKVVRDVDGWALYFSRSLLPYSKSEETAANYVKHIGLYGYRIETLKAIARLPIGKLEAAESLEQLRWLENGYRIKVIETEAEAPAIDTPEDLRLVEEFLRNET